DAKVHLGDAAHGFGLLRGTLPGSSAEVVFLDNDHFFDRFSVYNAEGGRAFPDDAERWVFFQRGCLAACRVLGLTPDVIHAHESQSGLVQAYARTLYHAELGRAATLFTIHNLAYQGAYSPDVARMAGFGNDWMQPGSPLEMGGALNMM